VIPLEAQVEFQLSPARHRTVELLS
jgi:hypothetical protein